MSSAAIRAGRAFVEFFIEDRRIDRGLATLERKFQFFGRRLTNIGRTAFAWGAGASAALLFPLRGFTQFDDKIKELESLATLGSTSLKELREQAKQLGRDTSFTAIDVGGGMTEMARAGFNTDQISEGIDDVMNLARATQSEIPRATEIAAGNLRAFQLPIEDMTRVVNVAVATVNKSAIGIEDYAESMKYAAPIANMFGMSIEETSKAIGVLGNLQIKGSLAGTALRNAMMRIADPKIRAEIEKFTPVVDQTKGRIREISEIMRGIGTAVAGEDPARRLERLSLMTELFGLRSTAAAIVLSENIAEGFDEAFNDPEFAAKVAKHIDSGIGGALRRLTSMWEGVTIAFGEASADMLSGAMDSLTAFLSVVRAIIDRNPLIAKSLIVITASVLGLGVAGIVAGYAIRGLSVWVAALRFVMNLAIGAAVALGKAVVAMAAFAITPVGLLATAVAGLAAWFVYSSGAIGAMSSFLRSEFGSTWSMIVALISSGDLSAAFALAMALVKTTFAIGIGKLKEEWSIWVGGLSGSMLEGTAAAELIWLEFTGFLVDAFDKAVAKIREGWQGAQNWLAEKIAVAIAGATGQDPAEVLQTLREDQSRTNRNFTAESDARIAERQNERQAKRREIEQRRDAQLAENSAITDENIANAQREANAARAEFDQAQARAAEALAPAEEQKKKREREDEQRRLADLFGGGVKGAAGEFKANEALNVKSSEAQKVIAEAISGRSESDKVQGAIENLQGAVVNQLEDLNETMDNVTNLGEW